MTTFLLTMKSTALFCLTLFYLNCFNFLSNDFKTALVMLEKTIETDNDNHELKFID